MPYPSSEGLGRASVLPWPVPMRMKSLSRRKLKFAVALLLLGSCALIAAFAWRSRSSRGAIAESLVIDGPSSRPRDSALESVPPDARTSLAGTPNTPARNEPAHGFEVHVCDQHHAPLAEAMIWLRSGDTVELVGRTDAEGVLPLAIERARGASIVASLDGFATAREYVEDANRGVVELVLERGKTISGWVEYPNGQRVGSSRVAAVREHVAEEVFAAEKLLPPQDPERLEVVSDAQGYFEFQHVPSESRFVLLAAGNGCLSRGAGAEHVVEAGASDERIVVYPTYGSIVEFVDEFQVPVDLSQAAEVSGGMGVTVEDASLELLSGVDWSARLVAISKFDLALAKNQTLLLAQSPQFRATVGPIHLGMRWVGFEPTEVEVELSPIVRGLGRNAVTLVRVPTGVGAIEVRFRLPGAPQQADAAPGIRAQLLMLSKSYGQFVHEFPRLGPGAQRIENLPRGHYRVAFELGGGLFRYPSAGEPSLELDIGTELVQLEIPLDGTGAIEFAVRDEPGANYDGAASIFIGPGKPSIDASRTQRLAGMTAHFARPPYRLPFVKPGEYSIRLEYPRASKEARTVQVAGGSTTRVDL